MSTKGRSGVYNGNSSSLNQNSLGSIINYQYAKKYNKWLLKKDFDKHAKDFGIGTAKEYEASAVHFGNIIDKKHNYSFVDSKGTTHKYNIKTNTYIAVDKHGYVITYFKPKNGIKYYLKQKKGKKL